MFLFFIFMVFGCFNNENRYTHLRFYFILFAFGVKVLFLEDVWVF